MGREPEPRVSVTSVPERWRELYFVIFSAQTLALIGLAVWYEVFVVTDDSWPETIFAIGRAVGPGVGAIMAESIIVTEGLFMVLFGGILRRREERRVEEAKSQGRSEGIAEGRSEGIAEGRSEGIAEGRYQGIAEGRSQGIAEGLALERKKWQEWNRRRLEAEAEGHPFTEPPPSDPLSENKDEGE